MWLQPPFFSMLVWHFGQAFVFATSQLYVSESSRHLTSHFCKLSHVAGWWSSCMHWKQKRCLQSHCTERTPGFERTAKCRASHHLRPGWSSTYERERLAAISYRRSCSSCRTSERTSCGVTTRRHFGSGQRAK